jgi:S-adenosylmethionine decarboxylase proenzyme
MVNLHECKNTALMYDVSALQDLCATAVQQVNLQAVGEKFHQFDGGNGITGVILLAESHLAIHTWPELGSVTLDVFVCNFNNDNSAKAQALFQQLISAFDAKRINQYEVKRV